MTLKYSLAFCLFFLLSAHFDDKVWRPVRTMDLRLVYSCLWVVTALINRTKIEIIGPSDRVLANLSLKLVLYHRAEMEIP